MKIKVLFLALLFVTSTQGEGIADWTKFPGAKQRGCGKEYALAVEEYLLDCHIQAYYVEYLHARGFNAVVIFRVGNKWRMVDNETCYSFPVKGKTVLGLVQHRNPTAYRVTASAVPLPLK